VTVPPAHDVAFVLGGGGLLGASQVGMLRALSEHGISPDVVLGTSVGAINGAAIAYEEQPSAIDRLTSLWTALAGSDVFGSSLLTQTATLIRTRTHLHPQEPLRALLRNHFGDTRIEDLATPFQCVAASIERAAETWFTDGPLVEAVLASSAVPGLLPPARIGSEHYLDGGLVDSIPVDRAISLGARTTYVLHVGRIESPLHHPRYPWEVGLIAFEIARRHRFATTMAGLSGDLDVHVLPTGSDQVPFADRRQFRYRDFESIPQRIAAAYAASMEFLAALDRG
jgi:NTE family protein